MVKILFVPEPSVTARLLLFEPRIILLLPNFPAVLSPPLLDKFYCNRVHRDSQQRWLHLALLSKDHSLCNRVPYPALLLARWADSVD
jgi:hypothetical protein